MGPIFWTHLGGKRDTLVTRWQYGFFLWVERIGEWGLIFTKNIRHGWKHAYQRSTSTSAVNASAANGKISAGNGGHWPSGSFSSVCGFGCNSLIVWRGIAETVAQLYNVETELVALITTSNAHRFYRRSLGMPETLRSFGGHRVVRCLMVRSMAVPSFRGSMPSHPSRSLCVLG